MKLSSERNIIAEIAERQTALPIGVIKGIGDDCAVVRMSSGLVQLWTTDTLVEGIHFDCRWHPPELLGRKAACVNISDVGAMGGKPKFALLSLGLTPLCQQDWLDAFIRGFVAALTEYDICLVGGDTVSSGERLMISVTLCGEMAEHHVRYRSSARPDDCIWVGGQLGQAACGLEICRQGLHLTNTYASLVNAHLNPRPQPGLGYLLAQSGLVHAMMDLSDGLATDLAHICKASGVGAEILAKDVPMSDEFLKAAAVLKFSPLQLALQGGDDYLLVFTAPPDSSAAIQKLCQSCGEKVYCLGSVVEGTGVVLIDAEKQVDISFGGYEHTF